MKKILVIILLITSSSLYSQSFFGGIFGGINGCGIAGNEFRGFNKLGFTAGVYTYVQFNKYNGLQLELAYSLKGDSHNPGDVNDPNPYTYRLNLQFIDVPLLYKLSLSKWFEIKVGLSYSVLLSHKEKINGEIIEEQQNLAQDIQLTNYHRSSLNFVGGISFNILPRLFVDFRASIGLTSFRGNQRGFQYFVQRIGWGQFTDVLTLTVGYRLFGNSKSTSFD